MVFYGTIFDPIEAYYIILYLGQLYYILIDIWKLVILKNLF